MRIKVIAAYIVFTFLVAIAGTASATLIPQTSDYFLDDTTGWYWYSNVSDFNGQAWATAKTNAESLTTGGRQWALASGADLLTLNSYNVNNDIMRVPLFTITGTTFKNGSLELFVQGWLLDSQLVPLSTSLLQISLTGQTQLIIAPDVPPTPWTQMRADIWLQSESTAWLSNGAFAVSKSPTPAPIPEPASMLLLGTGLAGAGLLKRRRRKKNQA